MAWFVVFACTVFGLYFWREHRVQQQDVQSASSPHRSGERYIGQVLTLSDGMRDGTGKVKLGNRRWRLRGPTVPAGTRVRVMGVDGTVLIVDRLPG
jgi:membrane protein implicated in regulation of membrane protease activity